MLRRKQKKSRRLTNLVPKKYSLPKDHFGREIYLQLGQLWTVIAQYE
jgi:hypothetical protein